MEARPELTHVRLYCSWCNPPVFSRDLSFSSSAHPDLHANPIARFQLLLDSGCSRANAEREGVHHMASVQTTARFMKKMRISSHDSVPPYLPYWSVISGPVVWHRSGRWDWQPQAYWSVVRGGAIDRCHLMVDDIRAPPSLHHSHYKYEGMVPPTVDVLELGIRVISFATPATCNLRNDPRADGLKMQSSASLSRRGNTPCKA